MEVKSKEGLGSEFIIFIPIEKITCKTKQG